MAEITWAACDWALSDAFWSCCPSLSQLVKSFWASQMLAWIGLDLDWNEHEETSECLGNVPLKLCACLRWCYFRGGRPGVFKLFAQSSSLQFDDASRVSISPPAESMRKNHIAHQSISLDSTLFAFPVEVGKVLASHSSLVTFCCFTWAGEVAASLPSIASSPSTTSHFSKAPGGTRWIGKKSCCLAFQFLSLWWWSEEGSQTHSKIRCCICWSQWSFEAKTGKLKATQALCRAEL